MLRLVSAPRSHIGEEKQKTQGVTVSYVKIENKVSIKTLNKQVTPIVG